MINKKIIRWFFWILLSSGFLIGVSIFSLSVGAAGLSITDIISAVIKGGDSPEYIILFGIRLPRIILGFAVGGALSVAGVILQGMFRNPLVDPYTLGISGGAATAVCLSIVAGLHHSIGYWILPAAGFIGSVGIMFLVYFLSVKKGMLRIHGMLLTGVMISFISSSLIMLLMAISQTEDLHGIVFWIMGSLEQPNTFFIKMVLLISLSGLIVSSFFIVDLNALSLGEEEAHHLGINTERTKRILFIIASLLTGLCVSVSGIIGFVGLLVPHMVRHFVGSDHRILLVTSYFAGGAFLILCDTIARTVIAPMELPVGVVTGILGGSVFIYALTRGKAVR
jgi:iron complex transport system permease protein